MNFIIIGRKLEVTDAIREAIHKKLGKLGKFFDESTDVNVTLSAQREQQICEVTIHSGGMLYRAEERNTDLYSAIDRIVDVIERQIRKNKTRLEKKLRHNAFASIPGEVDAFDDVEEEPEFKIVKTKRHSVKPMSKEEAVLQMNLLGHEFFVFIDSHTDQKSVVYRRKDGNYGLLEF